MVISKTKQAPTGVMFGCSVPHCSERFTMRDDFAKHFVDVHSQISNSAPLATTTTPATKSVDPFGIVASVAHHDDSRNTSAVMSSSQHSIDANAMSTQNRAAPPTSEKRATAQQMSDDADDTDVDIEAAALALCCCSEIPVSTAKGKKRQRKHVDLSSIDVETLSNALLCCNLSSDNECHGSHRFQHTHQRHEDLTSFSLQCEQLRLTMIPTTLSSDTTTNNDEFRIENNDIVEDWRQQFLAADDKFFLGEFGFEQ